MNDITPETSREQLAATISEHLQRKGLDAVLVGGAVVSIYTNNLFPSADLDLATWKTDEVKVALKELGFEFLGSIGTQSSTTFYIDLRSPPVLIGKKHVRDRDLDTLKTQWGSIKILSPLDCVLDRLSAVLHWNDRQCLNQAAQVAADHDVDLDKVRAWVEQEDGDPSKNLERFNEFKDRVDELLRDKGT